MKFSESWLRQSVNPAISVDDLVAQVTMAGLEVDAVEAAAPKISGVVVGEIISVEQHPDADKLRVCQVLGGSEQAQVVCGAPNARVGIKVPFATVGAVLPGDFKIKKAKLRGVESFGMLCAQDELGLGENHEGLMELAADAPVGADINGYLQLDDRIIEVDLTPNRSDCLGIIGLARETGLMNNLDVCMPAIQPVAAVHDDQVAVHLADLDGCPRFVGRVVRDVDLAAASPLWLTEKLRRSGIRSIDPVVDVTNYIMLELNQPMHAYDLNRLTGDITVRQSTAGEQLTLLNGSQAELAAGTLLITDASGPIGMAGIMGGASTAVQADTRDIYLEAAFFAPIAIAGRARTYGMHTDAGHRFERGVDYQGQVRAMERATELLLLIAGGRPGPLVDTVSESDLPQAIEVRLRAARVARVLGMVIKAADIENILKRLEFEFAVDPASDDKAWLVQSPSHRFDINIEADLIEEISRIIGYEALPVTQPVATLSMLEATETRSSAKRMKQRLIDRGYSEAINYSFVDSDLQQLLLPDATAVALKNPLSTEMSVMRTTLVGGLLKALVHNQNRQQTNVRLFEIGLVFHQHDQTALSFDTIKQQEHLALVLSGQRLPEGWANTSHMVDFFDLKGDLEALLGTQGISFQACEISGLQAGQSARILKDNVPLGRIGLLDASVASQFDLRAPAYVAEIDLSLALRQDVPSVQEVSKYPEVRRDIAILVARSVTATSLRTVIAASAGDALLHLKLFDVYMGKGIDPNQKSVGLGLTFQHPSRTLTDEEINYYIKTYQPFDKAGS